MRGFGLIIAFTRLVAAAAWLALALIVAVSGLVHPGGVVRNLVMAAPFLVPAAWLWARHRKAGVPPAPAKASLLRRLFTRLEPPLVLAALLVGALLLSGAAYRYFGEGMAVFG